MKIRNAKLASENVQLEKRLKEAGPVIIQHHKSQEELQRVKQQNVDAIRKLQEMEKKNKILHKMMIDNKLDGPTLNDADLQMEIERLKFSINQYVKKYCTNHLPLNKQPSCDGQNGEFKDYWIMSKIANRLHEFYKNHYHKLFGMCIDDNKSIYSFDRLFSKHSTGM